MRNSILAALMTLSFALVPPALAQSTDVVVGKAPGAAGVAQTTKISATITAIDAATRAVTLKGPQGRETTVVAGPEVKNFAQLKVGDTVEAQYAEALVLELKKGGGKPVAMTEKSAAASAKPGAAPGAMGARQVTVVGDVINVDAATQTVTVKGPKRTVELKVRDPEQFKLIAKGDQIEATYTEAVALAVTSVKK
jgi:hypothetical protein